MLPAGGTFRILGMGFSAQSQVQVAPLKASSIQYVSPSEIRVTVKDGGLLDGTKILVTNPDKSSDTYYSYLRGVPVGVSAHALLARTVPADYFTAIALQNPGAADAVVTLESHDGSGAVTGSTNIALPSGGRLTREVSELLGSVLPSGSYLRVRSGMPVQAMGLLGNDRTGVVLPLFMNVISGPAVAPAPDPGVSNGGGKGK